MHFDGVHTDDTAGVEEDNAQSVRVSRSTGWVGCPEASACLFLILSSETSVQPCWSGPGSSAIEVAHGVHDKATLLARRLQRNGLDPARVAYVGNDVNDLGRSPCPVRILTSWPPPVSFSRGPVGTALYARWPIACWPPPRVESLRTRRIPLGRTPARFAGTSCPVPSSRRRPIVGSTIGRTARPTSHSPKECQHDDIIGRIPPSGSARGSSGLPVYVIAEIDINHNGDLDIARRLIDVVADAGCQAVTFQKRTPEICVPPAQRDQIRQTPWAR